MKNEMGNQTYPIFSEEVKKDHMTTFVNFATKSPLVCDVKESNRHVFGMRPPLQGQFLATSISINSVDWKMSFKNIRGTFKHLKHMHVTQMQNMYVIQESKNYY